jgi:predicted nucleic acid-binding protein
MPWLMDTNVVSELVRQRPHPGVTQWASTIETVAISVVTIDELMFGLAWKPNNKVRDWLLRFLDESCDILPITQSIAYHAGVMRGKLRAEGITRSQPDMLIAATAHSHGLTLVTRNVRDFEHCEIDLLNPFG